MPQRPYVVALTGGIASGKTAVSDRLAELGAAVVDTDVIARQVVEPGSSTLMALAAAFGRDVLTDQGTLDRRKMRELIFSNPAKRETLESILHPAIAEEAERQIQEKSSLYCVLVVPLLVESGLFEWANRVLVVDVSQETQIQRVTARDNISREQALNILNAQTSREARLAVADDVVENNGSLTELDQAVRTLHKKYQILAAAWTR